MQVFVMVNKGRIKVIGDVNVKNSLAKVTVIKDLFGIIVFVMVNVINYVMLENT